MWRSNNLSAVFLVDPALDAVLKKYNDKQDSMNSEIKRKTLVVQENDICLSKDDEPDDESVNDPCSERVLPLDEEVIKRHRLTLDDIRAIPRFKDYQPGSPNEV